MAQGALKKTKTTPFSSRRSSALTKKGQRSVAPKKKSLVKQKKITKKYTAGLTGKTERALAEKVGHLEMLTGGKKRDGDENKGEGKKGKSGKSG